MLREYSFFMKNLDRIAPVGTYQEYLDNAFLHAKKKVRFDFVKSRASEDYKAQKEIDIKRIEKITDFLCSSIDRIINSFPEISVENLTDFEFKILECLIDVDKFKKSIYQLGLSKRYLVENKRESLREIKKSKVLKVIKALSKRAYSKIAGIMKRLKRPLEVIESSRKILRVFPPIDENLFSVCVAGFPNVGKSTLVKKITGSDVKIADYAFTTKGLLIGYIEHRFQIIQIIDTPGTLNRPNKMNLIEKQADIVISMLPKLIVFVFDPTFCIDEQLRLLKKTISLKKPMIIYVSKTDLVGNEVFNDVKCKIKDNFEELDVFFDFENIKNRIIKEFSNKYKKS
mgnify:CR=1 FL=1